MVIIDLKNGDRQYWLTRCASEYQYNHQVVFDCVDLDTHNALLFSLLTGI
jgi:hypothetical protein